MKICSFLLYLISFYSINASCNEFPKYPFSLITPSYHIVTEDDLAYDKADRDITPYNPKDGSPSALHWQCIETNKAKASYRTWRIPTEPDLLCAVEVEFQNEGTHLYTDRRGQSLEACKDFIKNWKRLTKNETIVCLNGEGGQNQKDSDTDPKTYRLWVWNKFKTKRGCYSYFYGTCNTAGCAKGKCPKS